MPQRTNEFQQVIHAIQHQLAGANGVTVSESKMLVDRVTGVEREVDVAIETEVANSPITIGVECRDRGRPADVTWVEQQMAKHQHLTDKQVLVSRSGFTKDALKTAHLYGMEALSFGEAVVADWTVISGGKFDRVYLAILQMWPVGAEIVYNDYDSTDDLPEITPDDVLSNDQGHAATIGQLAESLRHDPSIGKHVLTKVDSTRDRTLTITWVLKPGSRIRDRPVKQLQFRYTVHVEERSPLDLHHHSFRDAQVAYGTFDHPALGTDTLFVRVEREGKPATTVIRIPSTVAGEQPLLLGGPGLPTPAKES